MIIVACAMWAVSCGVAASLALTCSDKSSGHPCDQGLVVRALTPSTPNAELMVTDSGVEVLVSAPLLTITRSMVQRAIIMQYNEYHSSARMKEGSPNKKFFGVRLHLTESAGSRLTQMLTHKNFDSDLVGECNKRVLIASAVGRERVEAVSILIDGEAAAAEQFARYFTDAVRFDRYMKDSP